MTSDIDRQGGMRIDPREAPGLDLDEALVNPGAVFPAPTDVLTNTGLSRELKIDILFRWLYDSTELSVAEEEGMRVSEPNNASVGVVLAALHELTGGVNVEQSAPTKHCAIALATARPDGAAIRQLAIDRQGLSHR